MTGIPPRRIRWLPLSTSKRLIAATFGLLVIAVAFMTVMAFRISKEVIDRERSDTMRSMLPHADQLLGAHQSQFNTLILSVAANRQLWTLPAEDVERILKTYAEAYTIAERLYIIRDGDSIIGYPKAQIRALGPLALEQIRERLGGSILGVVCSEPYLSNLSNWTITIGVRVATIAGVEKGIIAMDVSLLELPVLLPKLDFQNPSTMIVLTSKGNTVITKAGNPVLDYSINDNSLRIPSDLYDTFKAAGSSARKITHKGKSYTVMSIEPTNRYGWKPVFISSDAVIRKTLDAMVLSALQMLLGVLAASFIINWILTGYFSKPLERLAGEVSRIRIDAYDGLPYTDRKDEVGILSLAVDGMILKIQNLISDLRESEKLKRVADMKAIDAQINPHFLFNTLNSIGHCASMGRTDDVHTMVQALVHMLSMSLDKISEKVMLAKELEFLNHYFKLLKLTRPDEFSVIYAIAPRTGSIPVPKLILQPLVENSILHGFNGLGHPGILTISAQISEESERTFLVLVIEDNGHGIPESAPGTLASPGNRPDGSGSGIGLRSVAERISHHYGKAGSFSVTRLQCGTAATIRIPLQEYPS